MEDIKIVNYLLALAMGALIFAVLVIVLKPKDIKPNTVIISDTVIIPEIELIIRDNKVDTLYIYR